MAADIFGTIIDGSQIEQAAIDQLVKWMPTYMQEIELQRGVTRGSTPSPRTYTTRNEFTTFPEDQMPICVVISPGLASEPKADGEGIYHAWWTLGIGVVASGKTQVITNNLAKIYGAAVRAILLQKPIHDGVEWIDESYEDVPDPSQERSMRAARIIFRVFVDDVVTRLVGPPYPVEPDPVTQPGSPWPIVETADVTVNIVEEVR